MSSAEVQLPPKPQKHNNIQPSTGNATKNQPADKLKKRLKHDRNGRRRSRSFSGCGIGKLLNPKPVLPTKFLLGGNINDPLNLNSLQDEEINRAMNAVTPKSSPIPTPPRRKEQIEVIIPPNINDPLNLIDCADDAEYEMQLCSPIKKGRKKRLKKRRTISTATEMSDTEMAAINEAKTPECQSDSAKVPEENIMETSDTAESSIPVVKPAPVVRELSLELSPKKDKVKRKSEEHKEAVKKIRHSLDKIVSPVVPQPGAWLKRMNSVSKKNEQRPSKIEVVQMPHFKEKDKKFQYGNYNRYYGYRNLNNEVDYRLKVFSHHPYLFEGKDILDIGCNIGHVTLSVARDFGAKTVLGIDIDDKLISIARKNIKHYVKSVNSPRADEPRPLAIQRDGQSSSFEDYPRSKGFPNNVTFKRCNYVLEDDSLLALEQPQFDTILCLSVTKWIHLNWGDNGLKQAFRRMYAQLRPGGRLILEPQNWPSYKGKKKLTETIFKNFNSIEFLPNKFTEYLLSPVVGFAKSEILGYPQCHSKGFRRPIQLFTKSTMFPSERLEATPSNITPNNPIYNDSLYQSIMKSEKYGPPNSDSIDYVYTGILNRYCNTSEDNTAANESIEKNLREADDANSIKKNNLLKVSPHCSLSISGGKKALEPVKDLGTCCDKKEEKNSISEEIMHIESAKSEEIMDSTNTESLSRTLTDCEQNKSTSKENCKNVSEPETAEKLSTENSFQKSALSEKNVKESDRLRENT
ncbi:hypothetical protein WA026_011977 [Henosepilachna vigintioctopunctata]|uniref:RNA methyltransferase n=1 Tax=Henosepilachna vigintioctopunctata TaxID=420089 RepID=A0AAW1V5S9_9CUCU